MVGFAYDPERVRVWANEVVNYLNGGNVSINNCSKKFSEQIEKLVQPNVWTGAAAAKNYQNFLDAHQSMINFVNKFGRVFEEAMNSENRSLARLESSNLAPDTNVASTFGTLSYEQLNALSEQNILKDHTTYDYVTISSIGEELKNILFQVESVKTDLVNKINEINNESGMWDGNKADESRKILKDALDTGMNDIEETLNICISNISVAAENARVYEQG